MEKGGLVIYEVENDKVKLVLGLGTSDKWDHIATVDLGVTRRETYRKKEIRKIIQKEET